MAISLKTHKLLWGRSGSQCAICKTELIIDSADPRDDPSIVGDEAHIVARKESFTRGDYDALPPEERDSYSNLILLCKKDHKQIDDQPNAFTVERLQKIKATHELEIRSRRSKPEEKQQEDEIIYAGYVDEWQSRADLDNWRNLSFWMLTSDAPGMPIAWYEDQRAFITWIIGRIWPERHKRLESALINYKAVLQDLLNVFDRHSEPRNRKGREHYLFTEKFYKIQEWDAPRYNRLAKQYEAHVDLVCALFYELTRAANYVCDQVRECLFQGYRLQEGVLLVERVNVGFDLRTTIARPEYRGKERTKAPYPGLARFKKIRYSRDLAISPNQPELPSRVGRAGRMNL
jgi:hypothetical protein